MGGHGAQTPLEVACHPGVAQATHCSVCLGQTAVHDVRAGNCNGAWLGHAAHTAALDALAYVPGGHATHPPSR